MHTPELFLDIETVPGQSDAVKQSIRDEIAAEVAEISAPGNYKDPIKIAAYIEEKRAEIEGSFDERHHKTGLSGRLGEVLCISWAWGDGEVRSEIRELGSDEGNFLDVAMDALIESKSWPNAVHTTWIAHGARDFDLRFLFQRCVIKGIAQGVLIPHDAGPSDTRVYDTMTKWAGWGNRISLNNLCRALGIPEKDGIDGSMVYGLALAGEYDKIASYCRGDVERLRQAYRRMTFTGA